MEKPEIEATVKRIIVDLFGVDDVREHMSLIDDFSAESIDFVDLAFRLEEAFRIPIREDEVYKGTLDLRGRGMVVDGRVSDGGMKLVREAMPGFDLSRFPGGVVLEADLPRLVTVGTVTSFIERQLAAPGDGSRNST
jgi:acyl carrier protein